mmetsp:Transcript_12651/g.44312  ORF Transcript_12651/g.44312 Transcript_12651/m.44312 type:complete len:87 (-) Transcript_12651:1200-1460(-)
MWYITLGERPFDKVPAQVVAEKASKNDLRPNLEPIIQVAGNEFASLIEQSWHKEPNLRPSASELVDKLEELQQQLQDTKKKKCIIM